MKEEELTTQEKQAIWMKNAGFLYDRLVVHKLKWPSLTINWLPYVDKQPTHTNYRFLYATHSSGQAPLEHIYLSEISFPQLCNLHQDPKDLPPTRVQTLYRFTHEAEVNRVRHSPQNPDIFAARTDQGPIAIFRSGAQYPVSLLEGSLNGGFALDWQLQGIAAGDFDGKVLFWKGEEEGIQSQLSYGQNIEDLRIIDHQTVGIVGDDGRLALWDIRMGAVGAYTQVSRGQKKEVYCLAPNPKQNHLLLTGGQDEIIRIWDLRQMNARLHQFQGHEGSVMSVDWSPVNSSVFASGGKDHKVKIWDLMRVGFQIPKDLGGTDQLLFTHEGHQGEVNQVSWNHQEMILASTEQQNNTLQFYQITNNIHDLEYAEDLDYLHNQCFG